MGKLLDTKMDDSFKRSFWIGAIMGFIVIGVAMVGPLQPFKPGYDKRLFDSDAKANLHNMFLACKGYWAETGSENNCTPAIASGLAYGYIQSADVNVSANGAGADFSGTAQNINSDKTFSIDSNGTITEVD